MPALQYCKIDDINRKNKGLRTYSILKHGGGGEGRKNEKKGFFVCSVRQLAWGRRKGQKAFYRKIGTHTTGECGRPVKCSVGPAALVTMLMATVVRGDDQGVVPPPLGSFYRRHWTEEREREGKKAMNYKFCSSVCPPSPHKFLSLSVPLGGRRLREARWWTSPP